jgi:hypothetical protein
VLSAVKRVMEDKKKELDIIFGGIAAAAEVIATVFTAVIVPALKLVFKKGGPFDVAFGLAIDIVAGLVITIGKVKDVIVWLRDSGGAAVIAFKDAAAKPLGAITDAFGDLANIIQKIIDGVEWLIKNIKRIPVPNFGGGNIQDVPITPGDRPRGDAHITGGYDLMGASPVMAPFAAAASGYGLRVTSGLRPGAITANGTPSDHGIGKALDVAGSASAMAGYFMSLIGNRSVKQAFYDPRGSIFGGGWSSYREGGHSDHVHVATYDKGGWLMPGLTLARNLTGRPERIVGPNEGGSDIVLVLDGEVLGRYMRKNQHRYEAANGTA